LRKTVEYKARKKFILDAARRLYEGKGIENVSMDDIAAAAEYTRRTLYSYFKSRDEISVSLFIEDLQARWKEQKEELAKAERGLDKVITWAESMYEFTRRHPHSIHLQLYWDFLGIDRKLIDDETFAEFESINNDLAEGLREIFRLGISDGSLRPDLPVDITISQFVYTLRSILNRALSPTYSFAYFDPDEYFRYYLDGFVRNIKNEGVDRNETD